MVIQTARVGTLNGIAYYMPVEPFFRFMVAWVKVNILRRATA